MKTWEIKHNENTIKIESDLAGERLFVNGALQDKQCGFAYRSRLWGRLPSGEEIKASLGGWFKINCYVFVDNVQVSAK